MPLTVAEAVRLRRATDADVPALAAMGNALLAALTDAGAAPLPPPVLLSAAGWLVETGGCWVLETDTQVVGGIGVLLAPSALTGELVASEALWWVDPDYRRGRAALRLWEAAEAWAVAQRAVWFHMAAPATAPDLGRLYVRRGYSAVETIWRRRLVPVRAGGTA